MIKITFSNGDSKNYNVGCRDLKCTTWDDVDYQWAFSEIANILGLRAIDIDSWRVI